MRARGFTLIEMIISLTLISLLAVVAAPLLRLPLAGWMDASRRSALTQSLDIAHAKLADDFARALPNSVRVRTVGGRVLIETLEVRASGQHRAGLSLAAQVCPAACTTVLTKDALEAGCTETCFTSIGALDGDAPAAGDWVVVNPLGPGVPGGDPYFGGNVAVGGGIKTRLQATAAAPEGTRLTIAGHSFPSLAANRRFWLVATPVTWDCNPTTQTLTRRWGYAISAAQPAAFAAAANASPLATNVAACAVRYTPAGAVGRGGLVTFSVRLAQTAADTNVAESVELNAVLPVSESR